MLRQPMFSLFGSKLYLCDRSCRTAASIAKFCGTVLIVDHRSPDKTLFLKIVKRLHVPYYNNESGFFSPFKGKLFISHFVSRKWMYPTIRKICFSVSYCIGISVKTVLQAQMLLVCLSSLTTINKLFCEVLIVLPILLYSVKFKLQIIKSLHLGRELLFQKIQFK